MRIVRLDLRAFGPFQDATLNFDADPPGLHIVYGPNEAGKSSALRALRCALYGIPHNSPDDFRHKYADMRIGATLCNGDGTTLRFLRRKGAKNTLRGPDDQTLIEADALEQMLGGVSGELFSQMFGIDHATLVRGGREAIAGEGALGELLFSAGSGMAGLRSLQAKLESDAEELFRPRGSNYPINKLLSAMSNARKEAKALSLRGTDWLAQREAVETLEKRKQEVIRELEQLSPQLRRLERFAGAMPAIARRRAILEELATLADAKLLRPEFVAERAAAMEQQSTAEATYKLANAEIERLAAEIAKLAAPAALLARAAEIDELQRELGSHAKAMRDRPGLVADVRRLETEALAILADLGYPASIDEAQDLRLTQPEKQAIRELAKSHAAIESRLQSAQSRHDELTENSKIAQAELERLPPVEEGESLDVAIRRAEQWMQSSGEMAALADQRAVDARQAEIELRRLEGWSGSLTDLEQAPIPSLETIDRFASDLQSTEADLQAVNDRIAEEDKALVDVQSQLRRLELQHDIPTEADLIAAREARHAAWLQVQNAWRDLIDSGQSADRESLARRLEEAAAAYEQTVAHADELADRLRRESQRVAEKSTLLAASEKTETRLATLQRHRDDIEARLTKLQEEWKNAWAAARVEPRSPREMRGWRDRRNSLLTLAETLRLRDAQLTRWRTETDGVRRDLLKALGDAEAPADATVDELHFQLQRRKQQRDAQIEKRRELQARLAKGTEDLNRAKRELEAAQAEMARWNKAWTDAVKRLRLPDTPTPAAAMLVVDGLDEFFRKLAERTRIAEDRICGIDADAQRFAENVERLARLVGVEQEATPAATAAALKARLDEAQKIEGRRAQLAARLEKEQERAASSKEMQARSAAKLAALCQEAGCKEPSELPEAEARSARRRALEQDLKAREDDLHQRRQNTPLAQFIAEAERFEPDALQSQLAELQQRCRALEAQKDQLLAQVAAERAKLEAIDCEAKALEAEERAQAAMAELAPRVEEYARLRLSAAVLREAIERYRQKHQGPILARASDIFRQLTLGSFEGLQTDLNEKDEHVLYGARPNGERVAVAGMSEGTADQLYLALRLAGLEDYLDHHPPMPFIVDDILISFDNERSAAALQILAEIGRRTQVIFFTHEEHLLELAEARLDGPWHAHSLSHAVSV